MRGEGHQGIPLITVGVDVPESLWNSEREFIAYIEEKFKDIGAVRVKPPDSWAWNQFRCDEELFKERLDNICLDTITVQSISGKEKVYEVFTEFVEGEMNYNEFKQSSKIRNGVEKSFWKSIIRSKSRYGVSTMNASLFQDAVIPWNLGKLDTLLNRVSENIPGVTNPYLYIGNYPTLFPWHVEDLDLLSVNYIHFGSPKKWWVVPEKHFQKFKSRSLELANRNNFSIPCKEFLRHKGFLAEPSKILDEGEFFEGMHYAGEFMFVLSRAFHAGYNCGWNCAESVNLASPSWLNQLSSLEQCFCSPECVTIDIQHTLSLFQPVN
jgi:jumonji domain-containing protein 2